MTAVGPKNETARAVERCAQEGCRRNSQMALVLQSRNDTWRVGSGAAGMIAEQVRCLNWAFSDSFGMHRMAARSARRRRPVKPESRRRRGPEGPGFTGRWRRATIRHAMRRRPHTRPAVSLDHPSSGLEQVSRLPTPARGFGRPRHVQFLLLLGDVGQHRTQAFVFDNGSLVDLRSLVEGPIG
jgi:hypothetical protein